MTAGLYEPLMDGGDVSAGGIDPAGEVGGGEAPVRAEP